MPNSILPQDQVGQDLFNVMQFLLFSALSASEIFSVSVMLRRRRVSRYLTSSSRESVCAIFQPMEEQLELFIEMFVGRLPEYIRNSLAKAALVA